MRSQHCSIDGCAQNRRGTGFTGCHRQCGETMLVSTHNCLQTARPSAPELSRGTPLSVKNMIREYLHRVNLGQTSRQMLELFPPIGERAGLNSSSRSLGTFHNRQLHDRISNYSSTQLRRSILGMVQCYNALPQHFVNAKSVKLLQRQLQVAVAARARDGYVGWLCILQCVVNTQKFIAFSSFSNYNRILLRLLYCMQPSPSVHICILLVLVVV